jgi:hypothetical protein
LVASCEGEGEEKGVRGEEGGVLRSFMRLLFRELLLEEGGNEGDSTGNSRYRFMIVS